MTHPNPDQYRAEAERLVAPRTEMNGSLTGEETVEPTARDIARAQVYATLYAGAQTARLADLIEAAEAEDQALTAALITAQQ